jgi:peptide/nickel transport system permease protein
MLRFLALRFGRAVITLLLCVTVVFLVLRSAGDPVQALLPAETPPDVREHYRTLWGLDRPLVEQYAGYVVAVLHGDLGYSFADNRPAAAVVAEAAPRTLLLGGCALTLALLIGLPLGITAALRHDSAIDRLVIGFAVLGYATPVFFLGILLILLFALQLRLLPSSGAQSLAHLIMPTVTLALPLAGRIARFARTATLEVLGRPYIRTARSKGIGRLAVILRHALPNAAIPLLMFLGIEIGHVLGGGVVTETIFGWPGLGRLLVDSVATRDLAVVQAVILLITLIMVLSNLAADLAHAALDPRIGVTTPGRGRT